MSERNSLEALNKLTLLDLKDPSTSRCFASLLSCVQTRPGVWWSPGASGSDRGCFVRQFVVQPGGLGGEPIVAHQPDKKAHQPTMVDKCTNHKCTGTSIVVKGRTCLHVD